jgi:hypothetical protein
VKRSPSLLKNLNWMLESRRGQAILVVTMTYLIVGEMCLGHDGEEPSR